MESLLQTLKECFAGEVITIEATFTNDDVPKFLERLEKFESQPLDPDFRCRGTGQEPEEGE